MKTLKSIKLLLLLLTFSLIACQKEQEEKPVEGTIIDANADIEKSFVGTWQNYRTERFIKDIKTGYTSASTDGYKIVDTFIINADYTYKSIRNSQQPTFGTWKIENKNIVFDSLFLYHNKFVNLPLSLNSDNEFMLETDWSYGFIWCGNDTTYEPYEYYTKLKIFFKRI